MHPTKAIPRNQKTKNGRALRSYRRCWKVERLFAWLQSHRHILVRYDRFLEDYFAFIHLACIVIIVRNCF